MDGSRAAKGGRWFAGALAGALVLAFALTAPAPATGDSATTLRLDRSEGPPGTVVFATVRGYAACHAPDAKTPPADDGGGVVEIFWEGVEKAVGSAVVPTSGLVDVMFSVPADATAQRYSITSRCATDAKLTDDGLFVVTRSETPTVVPPETARPSASNAPTVVPPQTQTTEPETTRTAAPGLVRVPRVVGLKVADAGTKVAAVGLVLRVTSGDGDVVATQSPAAGSMAGAGRAVRVTVKRAVVPAQLVPVPNVVGEKIATARSALSAVGLRLGGTAEVDRDIVSQEPAPGTLVAAGTTITVTIANPFPWSSAVLLSLVVLACGAVTYRLARLRLDRRWVRTKLRVVVRPAPEIDPRLTESDSAPPMPVVRIEPHGDAGVHILEEAD